MGLISDPSLCSFDPFTMVGKPTPCASTNRTITISQAAARVANFTWTGLRSPSGDFLWYGLSHQADLTGSATTAGKTSSGVGYVSTSCAANGTCTGVLTGLGDKWLSLLVQKDAAWSPTAIKTVDEYTRLFLAGEQEYGDMTATANPDLSLFRDVGGKMLTYHGLADPLIPHQGTTEYHTRVSLATSNISSFFPYFPIPGLGHCAGGTGGQPTSAFARLVEWVEHGRAPEVLEVGVEGRFVCLFPSRAVEGGCVE